MVELRDSPVTLRRLLVGSQLRRLRTDRSISREQAGEAIRASEWKIHRLENGQVGLKERDIVDLLKLYGVTNPSAVEALLAMAREANAPGWWYQYSDVLPQWFRAYVDLESATALIRTYQGQLIPGLLQTEAYMRTVMQGAQLDDSPEELQRRVGSREVMRAQLERLVEATKLPNVTLQVLPFGAGVHPAMVGAFTILRFADEELPDVVYVEHLTNALYLDKRDDVEQYLHVMETISVRGEAPSRTAEILDEILREV